MPENVCGDCRFAVNERPNLELKRRDFDCIGLPARMAVVIATGGRLGWGSIRGGIVGGRDPACALFKLRLPPLLLSPLQPRVDELAAQAQEVSVAAHPLEDK